MYDLELKKTYETFKSKTDDHMKMENLKPALQSVGYNPTDEDLEVWKFTYLVIVFSFVNEKWSALLNDN